MRSWFEKSVHASTGRPLLPRDKSLGEYSDCEILEIQDLLRYSHSASERLVRIVGSDLLNAMPFQIYRLVTTLLKRIRGRSGLSRSVEFIPCEYMEIVRRVKEDVDDSQRCVRVCLTHDIDSADCYEYWGKLIDIEEKFGFQSTSNVLTKGPYVLDTGWLDELEDRGHEIGLHGDTHDLAMGFRSMDDLRERLSACLSKLDNRVVGFRAPGFSISENLLSVLNELGFRYDSSIKLRCHYKDGVDVCVPYIYPGMDLWEFPLAISDDALFRDANLSDATATRTAMNVLAQVRENRGVMVFNSHPVNMIDHASFYQQLLDAFASDPSIEIALMRQLTWSNDSTVDR